MNLALSTHRSLAAACILLACGPGGAFLAPTPTLTTTYCRIPSSSRVCERWSRQASAPVAKTIRMQASDEDLQTAVKTLASQVEDLTAMVKQLVTEPAPGGGEQISTSQHINGAEVVKRTAASGVTTKAPKELVSTAAAQQRIDQWLRELDGRESSATVADSALPVMEKQPAAAVSVPVTPEVEAPPVEAPPAAGASPESGYKVKIEWDGAVHDITCDAETTVLEAAMDNGIELPHSCMSGSCLTCPGKIVSGSVDQSEGVLEDDQTEAMLRPLERTQRAFVALAAGSKREALLPGGDFGLRKPVPNTRMIDVAFENYFVQGYMLTCVSYPKSDLHFTVIEEDDLP